ncbi:DNA damage repair protein Mus42 [Aspergillus sclerotiicarbonarius CBS 121057]|uniref:DNA repair protein REV1 n=1 Tax=Aspergillus sclerotiicarbonarius (strain CBS 121057 / IBT 28362) TaxID=1448318 RepID=A0A319EUW4_ASPSB|nr:DNA damage repair protein Mus42 [Aspergillus sclerotiicarbonarius CBS 121057]
MGSLLDQNSSAVRKRIQNHHFDDEDGEEYDASAFGGFGDYMRRKKLKLQNLDAEIRSSATDCPPIFRGVVAHVNGYTQPSLQDLHRLIVSHGGGFLQYLNGKTDATHIIASALTPKKREEFRRYRIVKPAWVVESVKAGRMLPWDAFRVLDEGQSQKVLKFDDGRMVSQTNSPKSGYREQTDSSWYTSQLQTASVDRAELQRSPLQDPEMPGIADQLPSGSTQSDYGEFPSFVSLDETSKTPNTPSPQNGVPPGTPPDKESPLEREDVGTDTNLREPVGGQLDVAPAPLPLLHESIPAKLDMTSEEYNAQLLSDPRMRNSSTANPEFIQQFYSESRLHHLSTWKADLKAQLQSAAKEKLQSQLKRRKPVPGARRYIMHVDFDCFFAAVSTLKRPELQGKPVAVAHGTGSGSEIASCNYEARAHGVKNGMWMKGALQACPELKVVPYDFPAYEDASRKFYGAILSVGGIVQSVSIDEALVDITMQCLEAGGSDGRGISEESLYREQAKADEIAEDLRATVKRETDCAVSVGIGGNILLAKVALREAKPAGLFQLKPNAVLDFIGNLTVQDLPGVGYSLGTKLEESGIKFVKDARDLSRERLTTSLGPKTGVKIWEYSRGIDRTEVGNEVLRKSVSAEVNWGIRFVNQTQADDFVRSLCQELHRRLVENLVRGKQLTLKVMRRSLDAPLEPVKHLGHGKCDVFNKSVVLGVATDATDILGKEAVAMLRSMGISPGDLRGLGVQMTKLEHLQSGSPGKSSQQQLNFKASPVRRSIERNDADVLDSPRKGETESVRPVPSFSDSGKPLNTSGTQFILPSQTDPTVVAELPNDIRSRLIAQGKPRRDSRSVSPCPPSRTRAPARAELPPQSQLDPDTLAALPEDVRAEILEYYSRPSASPGPQQTQPTPSPGPALAPPSGPSSSGSLLIRKPTSPPKKRRGRPSTKSVGNPAFKQARFVLPRATASASTTHERQSPAPEQTDVSAEFLAALPEDIRREVLEEQRRAKMLQRPSVNPPAQRPAQPRPSAPAPAQEKRLVLPPLPERPTFTSQKLSNISDLRDAISSWHTAFSSDGPIEEDVISLGRYLKRVIVDEKDMDKAVSVLKWLMWLIDDEQTENASDAFTTPDPSGKTGSSSQSAVTWEAAIRTLRESVDEGCAERGLPLVDLS